MLFIGLLKHDAFTRQSCFNQWGHVVSIVSAVESGSLLANYRGGTACGPALSVRSCAGRSTHPLHLFIERSESHIHMMRFRVTVLLFSPFSFIHFLTVRSVNVALIFLYCLSFLPVIPAFLRRKSFQILIPLFISVWEREFDR